MQLFRPELITEEILSALKPVFDKGWIGLGEKTKEFESAIATKVGAEYAVGLNSATSALHLSLIVAGVGEGDEVITTPMTFVSTNHSILYQRAHPIFVDIDPDTLNIDPEKIEENITPKTKAIMVVHYSGFPADMNKIYDIARNHNLWVIEDAAHAFGAKYDSDHYVGCNKLYGKTLTVFCFHAVKNLPMGDGGMITTNHKEIYERLKKLRWLGINKDTFSRTEQFHKGYSWKYSVDELGYKYHMNDISATIGLVQLKYLEKHNEYRRSICYLYRRHLSSKYIKVLTHITGKNGKLSSCHTFPILVKQRDRLMGMLHDHGIYGGVHYIPNHLYPMYQKYYKNLPVSEDMWKGIMLLPLHTKISSGDAYRVCTLINAGGWIYEI